MAVKKSKGGPNLTALRQLRRVVKAAPAHLLHMPRWFVKKSHCGTARCAAGWAMADPWFKKNGLRTCVDTLGMAAPKFGDATSGRALAAFFRLKNPDVDALFAFDAPFFTDPHDITKAEVLANIDRLLAGKRALIYRALRKTA